LLEPARRVLLDQAAADPPGEEASKGAEGAVPCRGSLGGGHHLLHLPGRDLGEELLAEHAVEPTDVGERGPGRAALEPAPPAPYRSLLRVLEPGRQGAADRLAEPSAPRRLPFGSPVGLRVVAGGGPAADDGG